VLPTWAHDSTASTPSGDTDPTIEVAELAEPIPTEERRVEVEVRRVEVRVFHGSLERAAHPVLVGHYRATPLSGAEGFVDRRYGRRLSDHLAADRYPGDIGESLLIEAPRHKHPHNGVLVVGLGEYGELTPNRLVETIRAALVRYALNQADRLNGDEPIELAISSVLLGATGEQGLSIASSARAVLDGVCEANQGLRGRTGGARAIFTGLELWERNAPEAELAFRSFDERPATMRDGLGPSTAAEYVPPTNLETADGAMSDSLPIESRDARWWRVRIADHSAETTIAGSSASHIDLEFTVGGRLARTGTVIHRVERRRLERILRDAVWREQPASGVHTTLFELLFPNQLKWDLMAAQDIQLEVDDATADIPWEMLAARNPGDGERGQLALRAALIRQLRLPDVPQVRRSTKPAALVIGNPPLGRLAPTLEGAYTEATSVRAVLKEGGFEVTDRCFDTEQQPDDATTLSIETALFADDYRIIHIAAHGFYQPDDSTRTGVAIGRDDFLTANVFRQLNVIPDVVFLNCCHLGAIAVGVESGALEFTRRNLNRLGASLARELIGGGVRAVVVAGWAVHDLAAQEFAVTFYRAMLDGQTFGWAVHSARAAAWNAAPDHSTWGAYQCYGDGGYALPSNDTQQLEYVASPDPPRTGREARRWLDAITNRIASVGVEQSNESDRTRLEGELETIQVALAERGWLGEGQLCVRLAQAWQALGDFDKAVDWYSQALAADDGSMTLADVEQLANLRDRLAASLTRNPDATTADRRRAAALIEQSMESITLLEQLSQSGERLALRAGHHKRRAATATGADRLTALEAATQCYLASYRQTGDRYALFNFIQLEQIRSRITGEASAIDAVAADFDQQLAVDDDTTYWDAVGRPDGQLTKALLDDALATAHDVIVESYAAVFGGPSTWAQRSATLDHLLDLAELHPDTAHKQALRALHHDLAAMA
jgi:tetratricopeptide (TPR) repeat protein